MAAAFSSSEYERRRQEILQAMQARGLDALLNDDLNGRAPE